MLLGLFVVLTIALASTTVYEATSRTTSTSVVTTTTTSFLTPSKLERVIFNESTICDDQYADRWAVTLGDITIVQPSNATFPFSVATNFGPAGESISKIIFTVPDGTWNWNVSARTGLGPASGTVDVNGSDVIVQLQAQPPGFCGGGLG